MKKIIVWSLFDSGNGSYNQVLSKMQQFENYSIGLDIENKNNHFINLDLANYQYHFNNNSLIETLEKLPKPNLIIASPPCESWSQANSIKQGNVSWKRQSQDLSRYTIRDYEDFEGTQFNPEKSLISRINGELCIFNTIKIIKHFKPNFYIIENPKGSKIWDYITSILGFEIPYDNNTYYSNYGYELYKPTKFKSNLNLNLLNDSKIKGTKDWKKTSGYNYRSNIPLKLVESIANTIINKSN